MGISVCSSLITPYAFPGKYDDKVFQIPSNYIIIKEIPCYFAQYNNAESLVIFYHGNAQTLQDIENFALQICQLYKSNILLIEQRGYGMQIGEPSFESIIFDGEKIIKYIFENKVLFGISLDAPISIIGYSIGTGISSYLATLQPIHRLILFSPFISIDKMAEELVFNPMSSIQDNFENLKKTSCPVLIFHGDRDTVINVRHSRTLKEELKKVKKYIQLVEFSTDHSGIICRESISILKQFIEYNLHSMTISLKSVNKIFQELERIQMRRVKIIKLGVDYNKNIQQEAEGQCKMIKKENNELKICNANQSDSCVIKETDISQSDIIQLLLDFHSANEVF